MPFQRMWQGVPCWTTAKETCTSRSWDFATPGIPIWRHFSPRKRHDGHWHYQETKGSSRGCTSSSHQKKPYRHGYTDYVLRSRSCKWKRWASVLLSPYSYCPVDSKSLMTWNDKRICQVTRWFFTMRCPTYQVSPIWSFQSMTKVWHPVHKPIYARFMKENG